ncbi:MAG: hypothetical protein GY721_05205 [Deltaproteobacteria bacterium]|nr:hypothetical protein [Deltaproteobacteria bacterium]
MRAEGIDYCAINGGFIFYRKLKEAKFKFGERELLVTGIYGATSTEL